MIKNWKIKMIQETRLSMTMDLLINGKEREILLKSLVNKVKYNSYNNNTETILVNLENYQVTKLLMVTQLKIKNLRTKMIQKMISSTTMVSSTNGKIVEILLNYQDHLLLKFKRLENSNIFTDNIKCI
jgi:TRAP-type mannitol/chloroaromatic compound transport system substrate-binding protein